MKCWQKWADRLLTLAFGVCVLALVLVPSLTLLGKGDERDSNGVKILPNDTPSVFALKTAKTLPLFTLKGKYYYP